MSDITNPRPRISEFAPKPRLGTPPPKLPEHHEAGFEAQMREHYAIQAERDDLRREVLDLKTQLSAAQAAMQMLEASVSAAESRVVSYQCERDQAVADKVKWEAFFISMQAQFRAFVPPEKPLVQPEPAHE